MAKTLTTTSIDVKINGNDYSKHVMFPFKVSNLLDEQLDEASLTLIGVPEKNFKPLTDVIVTLKNGDKTQSYSMLVASDKADEIPTGSGRYKHELYLIEQTKYLECFIERSIGYQNKLPRSYTIVKSVPSINVEKHTLPTGDYSFEPSFYYYTPMQAGTDIVLYSIDDGFLKNASGTWDILEGDTSGTYKGKTTVVKDNVTLYSRTGLKTGYENFQLAEAGIYQIIYSDFLLYLKGTENSYKVNSVIYTIVAL